MQIQTQQQTSKQASKQIIKGGQTHWPHANDNREFQTEIEKYSAIFWYEMLEDGNLDQATVYQHKRVENGEYIMGHIAVWDPYLPEDGDPRMNHATMFRMHDEL